MSVSAETDKKSQTREAASSPALKLVQNFREKFISYWFLIENPIMVRERIAQGEVLLALPFWLLT